MRIRLSRSIVLDTRGFSVLLAMVLSLAVTSNLLVLLPSGESIRSAAIVLILVLVLYGVVIALKRGQFTSAIVALLLLASVWFYLYMFAERVNGAFNPTAGGTYFAGCLCALFSVDASKGSLERALRNFFWVVIAYGAVYLLADAALSSGALSAPKGSSLIIGADELTQRDVRVALSAPPVCFGIAYCLAQVRRGSRFLFILPALFLSIVLWESNSRGILAVTAASCMAYILIRHRIWMSQLSLLLLGAIVVASVIVAFTPGLNPLSLIDRDLSGRVRADSIQIAQALIPANWLLGLGVPAGGEGYVQVSNSRTFYPSDIGFIGVMVSHGLVGLAVYVGICWAGCRAAITATKQQLSSVVADTLGLTGLILAVYSVQAPTYLGSSAAVFASLFLGLSFSKKPKQRLREEVRPFSDKAIA